jgi:hypothetical protein
MKVEELKGIWKGRRCFIIGTGASLLKFDHERLKPFHSIGVNESYLWHRSEVYALQDRYNLENAFNAYDEYSDSLIVTPATTTGIRFPRLVELKTAPLSNISLDLTSGVWQSETGTLLALQLALWMDANPIYLLGIDLAPRGPLWRFHGRYRALEPIPETRLRKIIYQIEDAERKIINDKPDTDLYQISDELTPLRIPYKNWKESVQ